MLKIKAWVIIQKVGTNKQLTEEKLVFGSRKFCEIVKFLEAKESIFDKNYWKNRRTKKGIIGHRNDDWVAYSFHQIDVLIP